MKNIEQLKSEVEKFSVSKKKAIKLLSDKLEDDESIEGLTQDNYNSKSGLWAFTDKRIIFVNKSTFKQWNYSHIIRARFNKFIIFTTLYLKFPDEKLSISLSDSKKIYPEFKKHISLDIIEETHKFSKDAFWGIAAIVIVCFLINSCFGASNNTTNTSNTANSQVTEIQTTDEQTMPEQQSGNEIPELICQQAGVGDTLDSWKDEYGDPTNDNDTIKTFENDKLLTVFADDRALNITIQNNKNGKKDNDLINKILPTDVKKISEEDTSDDVIMKHREIYHSDLIQKVIPGSDGTVTVIDQFDKKSGKYLTTTIDCTPNI